MSLRANHVQLNPQTDNFLAQGNVLLKTDELIIQASQIEFDHTKQHLTLRNISALTMPPVMLQASLATASLRPLQIAFRDYVVKYDTQWAIITLKGSTAHCSLSQCSFQQSTAYLCPHNPHLLAVHSRNLIVKPDGAIQFVRPTLSINKQPVLKLPRFTLRPPSKPGLLFPRLLWTPNAGLIVGPTFYMPLHAKKFAIAHVAVRSKGGMDSSLALESPNNQLRTEHVLFDGQNMIRLRTLLHPKLHHAVAAVQSDVVTHKSIIDETSFFPQERAITHTESQARVALKGNGVFIENHATYLQHHVSDDGMFQKFDYQTGNIGLHATILPLYDHRLPIQPKLYMSVDRFLVSPQQIEQNQSRFTTLTTIQIPKNIGVFSGYIEAGVLAQRRQVDHTANNQTRIIPGTAASIGLPLIKKYQTFSHLLNHQIQYRVAPLTWGPTPTFHHDVYDMTTNGHHLELAIDNKFGKVLFDPTLRLNVAYHQILPQMKKRQLKQIFAVELYIKTPFFHTDAKSGWTLGQSHPEFAEIELQSKNKMGTGFTTGVFYYGANSITGATVSSLHSIIWPLMMPTISKRQTVATEEISVALSHQIHMTAGTQLSLYPGIGLSALYYQLNVSTQCRCLTASIIAAHIPETFVPKTMLTLTYHPQ